MTMAATNNTVLEALLIRYSKFKVERIIKISTRKIIFIAAGKCFMFLFPCNIKCNKKSPHNRLYV